MLNDPYHLLPVALHAASAVLRNPLLAEEAGERALHQLTLQILQGVAPRHPRAWLRKVARRSAVALLNSEWARQSTRHPEEFAGLQAPYARRASHGADVVRERLQDELSPRQHEALDAAIRCSGTREAARACRMAPRDFRRQLGAITRKARQLLQDGAIEDPAWLADSEMER